MAAQIKLPVPGMSESAIAFDSPDEFARFARFEFELWKNWMDIATKDPLSRPSPLEQSLSFARGVWNQAMQALGSETAAEEQGTDEEFQKASRAASYLADSLRLTKLHISRTPIGANILNLSKLDVSASVALWGLSISPVMGEISNYGPQALVPFWQSISRVLLLLSTTSAATVHEDAALRSRIEAQAARDQIIDIQDQTRVAAFDATNRLGEAIRTSNDKLRDEIESFLTAKEEALAESKAEWVALRKTYDLKLKTAAPYNYWKMKRVYHQRSAKRWGEVFAQLLVFGPVLLAGVSAIFISSNAKFEPPYILPISCLAVPAFAILWAARLSNRKYNEEQLRAEDANERATMVKTLLALTRKDQSDSDIADAEMAIMLTALFRPGPGLNAEDSPAVSILETALKSIRGEGRSG